MKDILEILLVIAILVAFSVILCALMGGLWFAIQPDHEADAFAVPPLDGVPSDREFSEPQTIAPALPIYESKIQN